MIHFEIRRKNITDCLQREYVEIFDTAEDSDYFKELKKLSSVSPNELEVIIITNLHDDWKTKEADGQ